MGLNNLTVEDELRAQVAMLREALDKVLRTFVRWDLTMNAEYWALRALPQSKISEVAKPARAALAATPADALAWQAEKERDEVAERDTSAWRECVRQEVADGTYDLVPEPEPTALDPALREPMEPQEVYGVQFEPRYVEADEANARIAALAQEIDRLQALADFQTLRADTTHKVFAALEESEHQKAAHIAGEPARQRAAVVAELRPQLDWILAARCIGDTLLLSVAKRIAARIAELEREGAKETKGGGNA